MSNASLEIRTEGISGKGLSKWKNTGRTDARIDYDATNDNRIMIDAMTGQSGNYQKRGKSLINIYTEKGCIFSGTFEKLVEALSKK